MNEEEKKTAREITKAMRNVGLRLDSNLMNKCISLCSSFHVEPFQLAESWEAYSLNKNVTLLDEHTFAPFRQSLLKDLEQTRTSQDDYDAHSSILKNPVMKRNRVDTPTTPNKKHNDQSDTPQRRVSMSPSQNAPKAPPYKPTPTLTYQQRKEAGMTVFTYNPHTLDAILPRNDSTLHPCTDIKLYGTHNIKPFRYMFSTLERRAEALNDHLLHLQNAFFDESDLPHYEAVGVPRQAEVTVIGRICNEAHNGRLNATSVLLEAPKSQNGIRVNLRLDAVDSYSLFPGQIVKVDGINATGRSMVATSISEGCPLPMPTTPARQLLQFQHFQAQGRPLQVMMACGPFTTDNLEYEPFNDFILGTVKEKQPDVVLLMGPFVDLRQKHLQDHVSLTLEEDSMTVSFETLFMAKITNTLERLFEDKPDLITQFVFVPSSDDAVSEPVFPQSPLQDRIPNGKPANLPHSEGIELGSLFLDNIEAIPHSFPKKHKRIHLVSNPSTIQINEIVIGITSMDVLFHIGCEETNSKLMGNRLSRLAQHILQQRSFYPLFPPPMGAASLDLNQMEHWNLPCTPDILIVPSKLKHFCYNISNCMVVNPGHISKGMSGGTFGSMSIYPINRDILEGVDGEVEMRHNLADRMRVDITKI